MKASRIRHSKKAGFTLIEAMISILVLSVGILALGAVYAQGIYYTGLSQYDYIADKKAEQAVEAIFTARDTKILKWADIQNVSQGGVFMDGAQPILVPGADGLVGDQNDAGSPDELVIVGPGPDGVFGTADDETIDVNPWMTRTITFSAITNEPNLRQITVTINYKVGQNTRTYTLVSYISAFA